MLSFEIQETAAAWRNFISYYSGSHLQYLVTCPHKVVPMVFQVLKKHWTFESVVKSELKDGHKPLIPTVAAAICGPKLTDSKEVLAKAWVHSAATTS